MIFGVAYAAAQIFATPFGRTMWTPGNKHPSINVTGHMDLNPRPAVLGLTLVSYEAARAARMALLVCPCEVTRFFAIPDDVKLVNSLLEVNLDHYAQSAGLACDRQRDTSAILPALVPGQRGTLEQSVDPAATAPAASTTPYP